MNVRTVTELVATYGATRGGLIAMLEEIQHDHGYLPEDVLRQLAAATSRSLVDIYGIATFYKAFTLAPRGRHVITVCLGTACHVRGAPRIVGEFERLLAIKAGDTTADGEFTLETVNCLGACALGPIVVADGRYFSNVSTAEVADILARTRAGVDAADPGKTERDIPMCVRCPRCEHSLLDPSRALDGHPSIRLDSAFDGVRGWVRLSSLYGSRSTDAEYGAPEGVAAEYFCPHCHARLTGPPRCAECDAPLLRISVRGGGVFLRCSRSGCNERFLDVRGPGAPAEPPRGLPAESART
ncbi:MAG TPA: hypothetical protein DCM87_08865 [Planctomycetes bacterium]|jgi:NADH-quinone oxidoreductase subunit E|nr:hypothetical protein [Planctomycetota bacterium]